MWFLLKGTVSEIEFVSDKLIGIQKILLDHGLQRVFKFFFLDSQEGSPPPRRHLTLSSPIRGHSCVVSVHLVAKSGLLACSVICKYQIVPLEHLSLAQVMAFCHLGARCLLLIGVLVYVLAVLYAEETGSVWKGYSFLGIRMELAP